MDEKELDKIAVLRKLGRERQDVETLKDVEKLLERLTKNVLDGTVI